MENVNFQPSGEEIERALMDLGPLLGVTIKEEVSEELQEPSAPPPCALNVSSTPDGGVGGAGGEGGAGGDAGEGAGDGCKGSSADSLESPGAARAPFSDMRCVLCHTTLALAEGTPKLMECLHSVCEPCVKAKVEEKHASSRDFLGAERVTVMCPACRLQCQVANMIDQRFVLEKLALEQAGTNGAAGEQQCNSCEEPEPATSYCADCAEFICDNCVHAHQRLKITKDHTIKSKEEAMAELQAQSSAHNAHDMFCSEHVQERLALFCETCDRLTCRDCQLQHHRDHKYQFSTEMAAQARANISSLLSEVSYKRVLLGSAMKVIRERQQLIADKKKALVHEITQTVVKLTNAINTRGKQLVLRLNEVCDAKQRTLSEKKEALEQLAGITDHCVQFVSAALAGGSDTAVLHAKRAVCAHLQRIKSRRADIPNPEIPVRISLALDKLPDLLRVLSTIGAIVVDGKLDGGSAPAVGPYHPPAAAPAPAPAAPAAPAAAPAAPAGPGRAHSAVVALQHVAMHQSYVHAAGGAGGAGGAGVAGAGAGAGYLPLQHQLRARSHTPLRHPHVTSTTHPHHLHGVSELNLRGLLNAQSQRGAARAHAHAHAQHPAQLAMQHAYHQTRAARAARARRQVAHPATLARQRRVRDEREQLRGRRRAGLQNHAGAARARARRRHLHQPQDALPQLQRRRAGRAGQGVRGVRAGPHGHHRQAGLQRRAGGGRAGRARAVARARRALVHGRRAPRRPQRGLVRRVHGRRRAHVLRQVPQGVPPVLPHPHHRQAARRDGDVAVPAVRELRGAAAARRRRRAGAGRRPAAAPAEAGGARHAGAVLPVRDQPGLPRARAAAQPPLPRQDLAADVPGHDPHEAAAAQRAALLARGAVRGRLPPAVPQRLPVQPAGQPDL